MNDLTLDASVVMPALDGGAWIAQQLDALARQEFAGSWEIVVADNGSNDDTVDIVRRFAERAPVPVRLVDASDRRSAGHARNAGARAARGRLLAYCDCDDVVDPHWLAAAVRAGGRARIVSGVNRVLTDPPDPRARVLNPGGIVRGRWMDAFLACNFAVDRETYFAVGGFDESLPPYGCEDIEFCVRAHRRGIRVVGAEDMVVNFRVTTGARRVLRKVFLSAKAETIVWHRHPYLAPDRVGLGRALRDLGSLPRHLAAFDGARARAREAVTRWGHVVAEVEWLRGTYARTPLLAHPPEGGR